VGDDGIVLTDREREALAGLAEQIGDPWLARQLAGGDAAIPPPKKPRKATTKLSAVKATVSRLTAGWIGLGLVIAGALLALATFTSSTVLGAAGLLLMGFGVYRVTADKGEDFTLWFKVKSAKRISRGPQPPHTPPGAV
jgi:hypothetical protein